MGCYVIKHICLKKNGLGRFIYSLNIIKHINNRYKRLHNSNFTTIFTLSIKTKFYESLKSQRDHQID